MIVALVAWCFCRWICLPVFIDGASMFPAYSSRSFNFCWRPAYWLHAPQRGDIVIVRYYGSQLMLLKRALAFEGETVEFRNGRLYIDGKEQVEPYVKGPCDWNLPPRKVEGGCFYLIGDNRSMPMAAHKFGQVEMKRLEGAPLW